MKKINTFTILFIILIIIALLSWILPSGKYVAYCSNQMEAVKYESKYICPINEESEVNILNNIINSKPVDSMDYNYNYQYKYEKVPSTKQGLWQIFSAPLKGVYSAIDIMLFVLVLGGFINILMKSGSMESLLNCLVSKYEGNELVLVPILMSIFGICGSTYGMAEETIGFYLFIIPMFIKAGFNNILGMRVILLGAGAGVLASTVNPFSIGTAVDSSGLGIKLGDGLILRILFFIIIEIITILTSIIYAKKVRKNTMNNNKNVSFIVGDKNNRTILCRSQYLIISVAMTIILFMIVSVIPWTNFNIILFEQVSSFINVKIQIISGTQGITPIGNWWFGELTGLFLIGSILIGKIAEKNMLFEESFYDIFFAGCKDLLEVALVIGFSRGITIMLSSSGLEASILYESTKILSNLNNVAFILVTYFVFVILAFIIPSTSGLATVVMPIFAPLAYSLGGTQLVIYTIISYSSAAGLVGLISPTSAVLVGGLSISKISYLDWIRHILPTIVILMLTSLLFLSLITIR